MSESITAAELLAQLNSDPDYRARAAEQEEMRRKREAELATAEEPLVHELRQLGHEVDSVWQLVRSDVSESAVPLLLDHLKKDYPSTVREMIARALGTPAAKVAWAEIIDRFKRETDPRTKDGLAATIADLAEEKDLDEVIELLRDSQLGESRVLLVGPLERSKRTVAQTVLRELEGEQQLKKEAQAALRRRRARSITKGQGMTEPDPPKTRPGNPMEVSTSLDSEQLPLLLSAVEEVVREAHRLRKVGDEIAALEHEEELTFNFTSRSDASPVQLNVHKCDLDTLQVWILCGAQDADSLGSLLLDKLEE